MVVVVVVEEVERRHQITTSPSVSFIIAQVEEVERRHRITMPPRREPRSCAVEEVERKHRITTLDSSLESRGVIPTPSDEKGAQQEFLAYRCQRAVAQRRLPERRLSVNLAWCIRPSPFHQHERVRHHADDGRAGGIEHQRDFGVGPDGIRDVAAGSGEVGVGDV